MDKPNLALSIKQPWAWLICKGYKDIENRDWFIGRKPALGGTFQNRILKLPQRIYVHAGLSKSDMESAVLGGIMEILNFGQQEAFIRALENGKVNLGFIVGEVTITECVTKSASPWFIGRYGFVLTDPTFYDNAIPCKGQLGFFKPTMIQKAK